MFCYVYVLWSTSNQSIYIGSTRDLRRRLTEHNKGLDRSTKPHRPWELIFYEAHREESDARRRENYLKTTAGRRGLKRMIRDNLAKCNDLNQQKVYY